MTIERVERNIAWAAGLFEGEGSIGTRPGRKPSSRLSLRLQVTSTDEDVLRCFQTAVHSGGVYGPYGPYKGQTKRSWYWSASGRSAEIVLALLLPYLGERRTARAREVLNIVHG